MVFSMRTVMWVAMVGVLLTGGYWLARPAPQARPAVPAQGAVLKQYAVRIAAKDVQAAQPVFRVNENDEVAIQVTSDQAGTLMLHGYTDGIAIARDGAATVRFKAVHTGRFPLHLHGEGGSHVELAMVEIMPR